MTGHLGAAGSAPENTLAGFRRTEALGCVAVHADHRRLSPAVLAEIREWGYSVSAYTANRAAEARKRYGWGVASVFSDVPHIIDAAAAPPSRPGTAR